MIHNKLEAYVDFTVAVPVLDEAGVVVTPPVVEAVVEAVVPVAPEVELPGMTETDEPRQLLSPFLRREKFPDNIVKTRKLTASDDVERCR